MNATTNSITKILGIGEKNLKFIKEQYEIIKGIKYMVIYADLTYTATQYPHCNSGEKDIIKHGTKLVKVLKRIPYGFRSFENLKLRVMLMESVKFKSSSSNRKELKSQNSLEAAA